MMKRTRKLRRVAMAGRVVMAVLIAAEIEMKTCAAQDALRSLLRWARKSAGKKKGPK